MSFDQINIGAAVNDGTGDHWRDAFDKVNQNFTKAIPASEKGVALGVATLDAGGLVVGRALFGQRQNRRITQVVDNMDRNLPAGTVLSDLTLATGQGSIFVPGELGKNIGSIVQQANGSIRLTPTVNSSGEYVKWLIDANFDKPYFDLWYRHSGTANWGPQVIFKYIDEDNLIYGMMGTYGVSIWLKAAGVTTTLVALSGNSGHSPARSYGPMRVTGFMHSHHSNYAGSGVALHVSTMHGFTWLSAPLSIEQWAALNAPGKVGLMFQSNVELLGLTAYEGMGV
jgi:hypothetical protein